MASYTDRLILAASRRYGVKAAVLRGLIQVESGNNANAVSPAGAFGKTQFMPGTARSYGVRRGSSRGAVKSQVFGAAHYLVDLGYKKDRARALASYNGGPGNPQYGYAREVLRTAKQYKPHFHRLAAQSGGGGSSGGGTPGSTSVSFPNPKLGGTQMADMLRGQLAQAAPSLPPLGDIPAPAHSATNLIPMPKGPVLQPVATAEPQGPVGGLAEQLRQIEGLKGPKLDQLNVTTTPGSEGGGGGGPAATGKVRIAAGADRPGVKTSGNVTHFLRRVAAFTGTPITVTTGTNHNRLTVNGNVSDHWSGNAADIAVPVDSAKGDRIAGAALVAAGVPRARARQMVRRGGLWTLNHNGYRIQVIWRTNSGGNHHNHVHIGIRRG